MQEQQERPVIKGRTEEETQEFNAKIYDEELDKRRRARWGIEDRHLARELGIDVREVGR